MKPLTSPLLSQVDFIKYGFFTRNGGVSTGLYSSLNLRSSSNDSPDNIKQNRQIIADFFSIPSQNLIFLNQQHQNNAHIVTNTSIARFDGDGLVTKTSQIGLCIITADCVPILLFDNTQKIIGACHAGWKGALGGIIENTILKMESLGAKRENIIAAAGACISVESYEVNDDFYQTFLAKDNNGKIFFKTIENQMFFDLKSYVENRLKLSRIKQIDILKNDTFQDTEKFFSYRRSVKNNEADYGCQVSVIILTKP